MAFKEWTLSERQEKATTYFKAGRSVEDVIYRAEMARSLLLDKDANYLIDEANKFVEIQPMVGTSITRFLEPAWNIHIICGVGVFLDVNGTRISFVNKP